MMSRTEPMILSAFTEAGSSTINHLSWLYPSNDPQFSSPRFWTHLARTLDEGGFDLLFFDDRLAMPGVYEGSVEPAVRNGARVVKFDLLGILSLVAGCTSRLGLGATYSTTYYSPYHVARAFATLDHMSEGRAAWNIVTSLNQNEADNFGVSEIVPHDERYDRAEEFVEIVTGLWDSWDEDAVVDDRIRRIFADPKSVHELNYHGTYWSARGPLTVPRSPQRWPLLLQAGQSGRGMTFGARWGDMIFFNPGANVVRPGQDLVAAQRTYAEIAGHMAAAGREPESFRLLPPVFTVVAESDELAREKHRLLTAAPSLEMGLIVMSEVMNFDFGAVSPDTPITDELLAACSSRGLLESKVKVLDPEGTGTVTVRDVCSYSGLGNGHNFVGTGPAVADELQEWFEERGCDGFAFTATHLPGGYEDFVRLVIPELRRRCVVPDVPERGPLRQRLGFDRRFQQSPVQRAES
jgi:FMN-dependent oxidoreductase (nitrilotriacetate monooxygenase family)